MVIFYHKELHSTRNFLQHCWLKDPRKVAILWPPDVKSPHWKRPWSWKRLKAGGEGGDRRQDGWMTHWLNGHEFEQAPGNGSEKAMAPHSSTLAWKVPWMEEPGRLQSMGTQRARQDWATSLDRQYVSMLFVLIYASFTLCYHVDIFLFHLFFCIHFKFSFPSLLICMH